MISRGSPKRIPLRPHSYGGTQFFVEYPSNYTSLHVIRPACIIWIRQLHNRALLVGGYTVTGTNGLAFGYPAGLRRPGWLAETTTACGDPHGLHFWGRTVTGTNGMAFGDPAGWRRPGWLAETTTACGDPHGDSPIHFWRARLAVITHMRFEVGTCNCTHAHTTRLSIASSSAVIGRQATRRQPHPAPRDFNPLAICDKGAHDSRVL